MLNAKNLAPFGPIVAVLTSAWAAIFIRYASDASPFAIAFYRMLVASLFWLPFYYISKRNSDGKKYAASKKQIKLMILAGIFLCFHFATWISALSYTNVSSAVFLILTQPLMVAVVAHFLLSEKLNKWHILAFLANIAGSFMIVGADFKLGQEYIFGDFLAFLGAVGAGGYFLVARIARPDGEDGQKGIPLVQYLFPVYLTATIGLLVLCLINGDSFGPYSDKTWIALLALGLIPTVIGHSLFNWSLKYLPALPVNIALVGEPIGASILAYFLFSEIPTEGLLMGSPLLILAVIIVYVFPPVSKK